MTRLFLAPLLALGLVSTASADYTGPGFLKGVTPCAQASLMVDRDARAALGDAGVKQVQQAVLGGMQALQQAGAIGSAAIAPKASYASGCSPVIVDLDFSPVAGEDGERVQAFVLTSNVFRLAPAASSVPMMVWQKLSFGALGDPQVGRPELASKMIAERVTSQLSQLRTSWLADRP